MGHNISMANSYLNRYMYVYRLGRVFLTALLIYSCSFFSPDFVLFANESNQEQLDQLLQQVEQQATGTRTVQCLFIQERILTIFSKPVLFKGRMLLSRPDKLRWENLDPIPSALLFSGDRGLRCNDDAPPVHFDLQTDPVMKMVAEQIWTWANGDYKRLKNKFRISLVDDTTIGLIPTETTNNVIQTIRVTFERKTLQPITVQVLEKGGDSTQINFYDYQLNQPVDDAWFTTCSP